MFKTVVFHSDSDPNNEVIYSYHNCTLEEAVKLFRENCPGETAICLVYAEDRWVFAEYIRGGAVR